jgi:hypothetical protein
MQASDEPFLTILVPLSEIDAPPFDASLFLGGAKGEGGLAEAGSAKERDFGIDDHPDVVIARVLHHLCWHSDSPSANIKAYSMPFITLIKSMHET